MKTSLKTTAVGPVAEASRCGSSSISTDWLSGAPAESLHFSVMLPSVSYSDPEPLSAVYMKQSLPDG